MPVGVEGFFAFPETISEKYVPFQPAAPQFEVLAAIETANKRAAFRINFQKAVAFLRPKCQFYNAFDHNSTSLMPLAVQDALFF